MNYLNEYQLVNESRHQFVYGKEDFTRSHKLLNLQLSNPVFVNRNDPMVVCVDNFGLPNIKAKVQVHKVAVNRMAIEYLNFTIASAIMRNLIENIDHSLLKKSEGKFIEKINRLYINDSKQKVSSLSELYNILLTMKEFYQNAYVKYLETGTIEGGVLDLPIAFLPAEVFARDIKQMLNSDTYFVLIFDLHKDIPIISKQAINNFVSSRINKDISVKVVCDEEKWNCYYDMQGQFIEDVHDYETLYCDKKDFGSMRARRLEEDN